MGEQPSFFEQNNGAAFELSSRERLEWAAVPLVPRLAHHPNPDIEHAGNYAAASTYHIDTKIIDAITRGVQQHKLPNDDEYLFRIYNFIAPSLFSAQRERISYHDDHEPLIASLLLDDPELQHAIRGTAVPAEQVRLLARYPQLRSMEFAKLSCPFDFKAGERMKSDVEQSLHVPGAETVFFGETAGNLRFKVKRVDASIPSAIILRKRNIADIKLPDRRGIIRVVERRGLGVRGDDDAHLQRMIQKLTPGSLDKENKLASEINAALYAKNRDDYGWVFSTSSSIYGKYLQ